MAEDWINMAEVYSSLPASMGEDSALHWLRVQIVEANTVGTLYFPPGVYTVRWRDGVDDPPLTLPPTINLVFEPGAVLQLRRPSPSNVRSLEIKGSVKAGLTQIFDVFDALDVSGVSPMRVGAPALVYGQIVGPLGNEELYPQWWGAQTDPYSRAWNFPRGSSLLLKYGESVDALALQLCVNASRPGQTVRLVGNFNLTSVDLKGLRFGGGEPGGTGLRFEGPAVLGTPPLLPLTLPEPPWPLSDTELFVLLVNRLVAAYTHHIQLKTHVTQAIKPAHIGGNVPDDTALFVSMFTRAWGYATSFPQAVATFVGNDGILASYNLHLQTRRFDYTITVSPMPPQPMTSDVHAQWPLGLFPRYSGSLTEVAELLPYARLFADVLSTHVLDDEVHTTDTGVPNADPYSSMMRQISQYEAMLFFDKARLGQDASVSFRNLRFVGPIDGLIAYNDQQRELGHPEAMLPFEQLQLEHAHGVMLGVETAYRLSVEVEDCVFEGLGGDGLSLGRNLDASVSHLHARDCGRRGVSMVGGNTQLHLSGAILERSPGRSLSTGFDIEVDASGLDRQSQPVRGVGGTLSNVDLRGGAELSCTLRADTSQIFRFRNLRIESGGFTVQGTGKGETFPIQVFFDNCVFGGWGNKIEHAGRVDFRNCLFDPTLPPREGDERAAMLAVSWWSSTVPNVLRQTVRLHGCSFDGWAGASGAQAGVVIVQDILDRGNRLELVACRFGPALSVALANAANAGGGRLRAADLVCHAPTLIDMNITGNPPSTPVRSVDIDVRGVEMKPSDQDHVRVLAPVLRLDKVSAAFVCRVRLDDWLQPLKTNRFELTPAEAFDGQFEGGRQLEGSTPIHLYAGRKMWWPAGIEGDIYTWTEGGKTAEEGKAKEVFRWRCVRTGGASASRDSRAFRPPLWVPWRCVSIG